MKKREPAAEFTTEKLARLKEYLKKVEILEKDEPEHIPGKTWDKIITAIQETGHIPPKYGDRIGITNHNGQTAYYDILFEKWNEAKSQLDTEYRDIILSALHYILNKAENGSESESVIELIRNYISDFDKNISPENIQTLLPQLSSVIPQNHLIPNNKLANSLTKDIIDTGETDLIVSGKGKGEITTRCVLTYEGDNVKLSSRRPFTEFDRQVADAVTSLYEYGDDSHIITAATVYRTLIHATESESPSPQQIGAVTRSLDKMRFIRVQIDCTDELKKRNLYINDSQITDGKVDTYLLALSAIEVSAGGKTVKAYEILKRPILYDYATLTKQIITVPATLLDIRDKSGTKIANTNRRIAVKGYLLRRVSVMKGKRGKNTSRKILYETIYNEIADDTPSTKEQRLIREYIPQVLDYWTNQKFIKSYEEITQGRKKIGIEIHL